MGELRIDLNADLGESFGVWRLGHDQAMMEQITSASIACGFHAGDPGVMRETVRLALDRGVTIGAHPGFPDLVGFGRRAMRLEPEQLTDLIVYQVGALQAIARAEGGLVRYVKPHGALYNQAETDRATAGALVKAVVRASAGSDPLCLMASPVSAMAEAAHDGGVRLVPELFADRAYRADGTLAPRGTPGAVISDPEAVRTRAVVMVREGRLETVDGRWLRLTGETICLHGDTPGAPGLALEVRQALVAAGIKVAPFA